MKLIFLILMQNEFELTDFEKASLQKWDEKFSFNPEKENPYRYFPILIKDVIGKTVFISYRNDKLYYELSPVPEKYSYSYILIYSEKNRFDFIIEPLLTYWQEDIFEMLALLLNLEIFFIIDCKDEVKQNQCYENFDEEIETLLPQEYYKEKLFLFGIESNHEFIEIATPINIFASVFLNKKVFYRIMIFYLESLEAANIYYDDSKIKVIKKKLQILLNLL